MMMSRLIKNHGFIGWAIVAFVVVVFDYWAITTNKQTMSSAFKNAMYKRYANLAVILGWAVLTWHLVHPRSLRKTDVMSLMIDKIEKS
jgi:hypothetical protein